MLFSPVKTEPFTPNTQNSKYGELINNKNFSLPAMDDFIPKSANVYDYFYNKQTEITDIFSQETQQQDSVPRQIFHLKKQYKDCTTTPPLTSRVNKGLLHYYRHLKDLSKNETNQLLYYIQETQPPKICLAIPYPNSCKKSTKLPANSHKRINWIRTERYFTHRPTDNKILHYRTHGIHG